MNNQKENGFTLIEVIIVAIVVSILAAIAFPKFQLARETNIANEGKQIILTLYGAQKRYYMDNDTYATSIGQLDVQIPSSKYFYLITVTNNPSSLAAVSRNGNLYKFEIDENGDITCTDTSPAHYCNSFGF